MPKNKKFRRAEPADVHLLTELYAAIMPQAWSEEMFISLLNNPSAFAFILEVENQAIGFSTGFFVADEAEIITLGILPVYQRKGHATELLKQLRTFLCNKGVKKIFLDVRRSNTPARKLYSKAGFMDVFIRSKYYTLPDKTSEDAFVMSWQKSE